MDRWKRVLAGIGGRRVVVAFGALYVAVAVGRTVLRFDAGVRLSSALTVFLFTALFGAILLYGGYRLPETDVLAEFYPYVAGWCLAGFGVMAGLLLVYDALAEGGIANPDRAIPILTAFSTTAGFGVGLHDARARTRAHEVAERNRDLERARRQLEKTVARLEESNERLSESNERLEQFAYAASHDLQEPLRMVSSYLRLVERRSDDLDDDVEEYLEYAVDGADRMREMIDGLLRYSRIETGGRPFEPVDLDAVLADVRDDLRAEIDSAGAEVTSDPLPRVEGDEEQLRQVLQSLLENAIEYSGDEPPRIHVSAERREARSVARESGAHSSPGEASAVSRATSERDDAAAETGGEWIVSVRDEGIGIEPENQEQIFDVFQRLHDRGRYQGAGIGLALCQRIVERHGGEIWVDSEPGEGATFSFTVPATETT